MAKLTPDRIEIGKRLREARLRAGLKQSELAELSGVPRTNMPGYEKGTRAMRKDVAEQLVPHLDLEAADLLEVLSPSMLALMTEVAADVKGLKAAGREAGIQDLTEQVSELEPVVADLAERERQPEQQEREP